MSFLAIAGRLACGTLRAQIKGERAISVVVGRAPPAQSGVRSGDLHGEQRPAHIFPGDFQSRCYPDIVGGRLSSFAARLSGPVILADQSKRCSAPTMPCHR